MPKQQMHWDNVCELKSHIQDALNKIALGQHDNVLLQLDRHMMQNENQGLQNEKNKLAYANKPGTNYKQQEARENKLQ